MNTIEFNSLPGGSRDKRALAILEKERDRDPVNAATVLNNVATLNQELAKYDEAAALYKRALVILEKQLGSDHPECSHGYKQFSRTSPRTEPILTGGTTLQNRR